MLDVEEASDSPVVAAAGPASARVQALILAAGSGSRLGKVADGLPKCLVQIGGQPLIRRQLDALADAGVTPVVMAVGYASDLVRETVGTAAEFVLNPRYATTNSLYSFLLAREQVKSGAVILNSDVLFDSAVLEKLLAAGENSLAYDSLSGYGREHMKVAIRDGKVVNLSKTLTPEATAGENVGMIYLSRRSLEVVFQHAEKLIAAGRRQAFLAEAICASLGEIELAAIDIAELPWTEIDTPHDLQRARRELWPRLARRRHGRTRSWKRNHWVHRFAWLLAAAGALGLAFSAGWVTARRWGAHMTPPTAPSSAHNG